MLADPDAVQISADGSCYPKEGERPDMEYTV